MTDAMASCGFFVCAIAVLVCCILPSQGIRYEPNWKSIDSRPLPSWYDEGKVGIFIHWGVFSVPSFVSEWFWWYWQGTKPEPEVVQFMQQNYPPDFTYADFASRFTAEFYDPQRWAEIFNASGARYIVLTSKHHEGFCNWPTKVSFNWNSMDVGPKRDLVGELANAIRSKTNLHFGLYHSLFEWFNPIYRQDSANNFTSQDFVKDKTMPELYELVMRYKPDVVWSDGDAGPDTYWNSTNFLAWLYNDSPVKDTVVTNDRWGNGCGCKHGGFLTCDDRYNPGKLQNKKWENCLTIDKRSWGYRRNANLADFMTADEIITTLAETVSCGGNMLINVGPTHDGMIAPIFEERLKQMGDWLQVNGEAIYSSVPWSFQNDTITPNVWYTSRKDAASMGTVVYAIVLTWPSSGSLYLRNPSTTSSTTISLLGYPFPLQFTGSKGVTITVPDLSSAELPCQHGWVFKMTNIAN